MFSACYVDLFEWLFVIGSLRKFVTYALEPCSVKHVHYVHAPQKIVHCPQKPEEHGRGSWMLCN